MKSQRKKAEVTGMLFNSLLCDLILLVTGAYLLKTYVIEIDLSEDEQFYVQHTYRWIRCIAVLSMLVGVLYMIGCDLEILNSKYYVLCMIYNLVVTYIGAIWWLYIDFKHGPKDYESIENLKIRTQAAIVSPLLMILIYFLL